MAKKNTTNSSKSKLKLHNQPILSKVPLKKYRAKQVPIKSNPNSRSTRSQEKAQSQQSQKSQKFSVPSVGFAKRKSTIPYATQKSAMNQRMKQTIKYYLKSLKKKENSQNLQTRIFSDNQSGQNEVIKNAYKSKPIKKQYKKRQDKRHRSHSATPQKSSIDAIQISSSPLSHLGRSSSSIQQQQSQLSSSAERKMYQDPESNQFKRAKKTIGSREISMLFGRGKMLIKNSFDDQRSASISRRSSCSGSRNQQSQSVIMISSESVRNQYGQSRVDRNSHKESNQIDHSSAIEPQDAIESSHQQDISSSPTNNDPQYSVQKIVSSKVTKKGQILYEIKWVGYPDEQNTYEPLKNLSNVMKLVVEFQQRERCDLQKRLKEDVRETKKEFILSYKEKLDQKDKKTQELNKKYKELERKCRDLQKMNKVKALKNEFELDLKSQMHQEKTSKHIKMQHETKIENIPGRRMNQQTSIVKLSESQVQFYKPSSQMQIQKVVQISVLPERILHQSSMNTQKSQFLSTRHSSQNQEPITIQKRGFEFQYPERYLENLSPRQINIEYSQEIDYFESNPLYHEKFDQNEPYQEVSIDFLNPNEPMKEKSENSKELEMILEEKQDQNSINFASNEENLIQQFGNQGLGSQDLELMEYSFPLIGLQNNSNRKMRKNTISQQPPESQSLLEEFDCLNYFYPKRQNKGNRKGNTSKKQYMY